MAPRGRKRPQGKRARRQARSRIARNDHVDRSEKYTAATCENNRHYDRSARQPNGKSPFPLAGELSWMTPTPAPSPTQRWASMRNPVGVPYAPLLAADTIVRPPFPSRFVNVPVKIRRESGLRWEGSCSKNTIVCLHAAIRTAMHVCLNNDESS